jgi:hypothetical protein
MKIIENVKKISSSQSIFSGSPAPIPIDSDSSLNNGRKSGS